MQAYKTGIAALIVIVVIGTAALILSLGATFSGLWEADSTFTEDNGRRAFAVAEACLEDTLGRLRGNLAYDGSMSPPIISGSCIISIVPLSGPTRTVTVDGTSGNYTKKLIASINITTSPSTGNIITVDDWQEGTN